MQKKWYIHLLLLAAAAAFGKDDEPSRMGYHRVQRNDEQIVALLAQRVAQGLQTNDPFLYLSLVAKNSPTAAIMKHEIAILSGKLNLQFAKNGERRNLLSSPELEKIANAKLRKTFADKRGFSLLQSSAGASDDKTFIAREVAPEHQIGMLSRRLTTERLNRKLFSMPTGSALFAQLQQFDTAPYFQASYVQLVTDPAWNRIVYGDYQKWIKAYNAAESGLALNRPQGIVVDPQGIVYVADMGNSRVLALKLSGPAKDLKLSYFATIGANALAQPTELAWDDRGTIFDASDDLLWVIDRSAKTILAFHTARPADDAVIAFTAQSFIDLAALAVGRFDGRSDGNIYVADAGARKIHRLYFDGEKITVVSAYQGEAEMLPAALATDHWGNVYLADESYRKIKKFTAALEPLAELHSADGNFQPLRFQPLFGSIITSSNQNLWSGYDQALLLEKWTDNSGARRYELGIDFHVTDLRVSEDLSSLALYGKITDPGHLKLELVSAKNNLPVSVISEAWYNSGNVELSWDRRLPNGEMAAPGYYKLRQKLHSTYEKPEIVNESAAFYLPLYYYDDCGVVGHDAHLLRGSRLTAHGETVATDAEEVVYRFKNLNPTVAYEVKANYFSGDGPVEQALYAEQNLLHATMTIDRAARQIEWLRIPAAAIADRALDLRFVKTGGSGSASVAEIWLREANYDPNHPPAFETVAEEIPRQFALQQNYPNPFNPSTTIHFSVPENYRGQVSLRVYDMLGKVVRELVAGELAPGNYRQVWDGFDQSGRRLASGLYMYQLRAGNFSATRKLLLMK
jgi:flagellar hook assembly protein FlgD/DNA-binding beta-propeller fold protein YncE